MGSYERPQLDNQNYWFNRPARSPLARSLQESPTLFLEMYLARKHAMRFLHSTPVELLNDYYPQLPENAQSEQYQAITRQRSRAHLFREMVAGGLIVPIVTASSNIGKPSVNGNIVTVPIGASTINKDPSSLNEDETRQRYFDFDSMMTSCFKLCLRNPMLQPYLEDSSFLYSPQKPTAK